MAFTNIDSQQTYFKILYLGATGAGKTENLQAIRRATYLHGEVPPIVSPFFFEFLPLRLDPVENFFLHVHLFTCSPLAVRDSTVQETLYRGVDGIVFIMDSRLSAVEDTLNIYESFELQAPQLGISLQEIPCVIQYNKRDDATALPLDVLQKELNPHGYPHFEASALHHRGVKETLTGITKQLFLRVKA